MTFISDSGTQIPIFDYSSRDYNSIFSDLMDRRSVYLPEWTSTSPSDFGIVLLQLFSYVGDLLGYYLDRLAGEAFIQTATQPQSIINLAAMLDYQPTLSIGASATLQIEVSSSLVAPYTIPAGTVFSTPGSAITSPILFQTDDDLTIDAPGTLIGTVTATQGVTYSDEAVATSTGGVNQIYPLLHNPVSADSFSVFVDLGNGPQEWTYVQSLINSGPYDQVFTNFVDANGVFYIIFGDGVNGYVPTLGSPITATYQVNDGTTGNVGAGTITQPVTALIGVSSVTNPLGASGGAAAESLASIQVNAPASLKTLNRAVTVSDIETLAIQVPGVEWASAIMATYQLVNLYIAPFGGGAPSSLLQSQVLDYIDQLVMANTTVTIQDPTYVPINVVADVVLYDNVGITSTQQTILAALASLLSLPNTGFGFRVSIGLLYTTILSQAGVNYATITTVTREMLVTLTSALANTSNYTSISTTPLPETVNIGDSLELSNGTSTQGLVAAAQAPVGATSITVSPFTANAAYPIGSPVEDTTGDSDAVLLENEIPVVGTLTLNMFGGLAGT